MFRLFTIAITLLSLTLFPTGAFTQSETATPGTSEPPLLAGIDGAEDAAIRAMQSEGIPIEGPILLTFEVIRFDSEQSANASLPELVRRIVGRFDADRNGAPPYELADPLDQPLGDETVIYLGGAEFDEPIGDIEGSRVAIVMVRTGAYIHLAVSTAFRGDPLADLLSILEVTTVRVEGKAEVTTGLSGQRSGGLWHMLPTLGDVRPNFEITDEIVPEPFASASAKRESPGTSGHQHL